METLEQIAAELIGIMLEMTRFEWGAVVEYSAEDRIDRAIVASNNMPQHASVSQSLLRSAKDGTASLMGTPMLRDSHSIIASATTDALAATIRVGDEPVWQLYLATGEGNPAIDTDTPLLIEMLVHITGLVLSDHQRAELEIRQSRLQQDISYAREVQNRIMGSVQNESPGLFTEIRSIPGRGVAGDLVGLRRGPDGRLYCFIGDVSGKGPAAAMLMAATQAYLTSLIDTGTEIADIVGRLNRYIHSVSANNEFVTLWIGCVDLTNASISYVDAGHGYAYAKSPDRPLRPLNSAGGLPIGIIADEMFDSGLEPFPSGSVLFLCSDGVNEQPNPQGEQFGDAHLFQLLSNEPDSTFGERLMESLRSHAGTANFHDDVTFALLRT